MASPNVASHLNIIRISGLGGWIYTKPLFVTKILWVGDDIADGDVLIVKDRTLDIEILRLVSSGEKTLVWDAPPDPPVWNFSSIKIERNNQNGVIFIYHREWISESSVTANGLDVTPTETATPTP